MEIEESFCKERLEQLTIFSQHKKNLCLEHIRTYTYTHIHTHMYAHFTVFMYALNCCNFVTYICQYKKTKTLLLHIY